MITMIYDIVVFFCILCIGIAYFDIWDMIIGVVLLHRPGNPDAMCGSISECT